MALTFRLGFTIPAGLFTAIIATGLSASGATIYVSSQSNGTVSSFDAVFGTFNTTIASGLNTPTGLALDSSGNLYIAETETGNIWKYNPVSTNTTVFANTNSGAVPHFAPFGIAIDGSGNVWVDGLDSGGTGYLDEFSSGGASLLSNQALPVGSLGRGMVFDSVGDLFIASSVNDAIYEIAAGSGTITTYTTTGLSGPRYLAILNGVLYVSNTGSGAVDGYINAYGSPDSPTTLVSGLGGPNGEAFTGDGNTLFFTEYFNQDVVSCPTSNYTACSVKIANTNNIISGANGLAYDPNETVVLQSTGSPEPATLGMIGSGLGLLALLRRRKN